MHRNRALLLLLTLLMLAQTLAAGVRAHLREEAVPAGRYVRLDEVAALSGDPAWVRRLGKLLLGPAPREGERRLTRAWIRARLAERGYARLVTLDGPQAVLLHAPGSTEPAPAGAVDVPTANDDARLADALRRTASLAGIPTAHAFRPALPPKTGSAASAAAGRANGAPRSGNARRAASPKENARALRRLVALSARERCLRRAGRTDADITIAVEDLDTDGPVGGAREAVIERVLSGRLPGHARVEVAFYASGRDRIASGTARIEAEMRVPVLMVRRTIRRGEVLGAEDLVFQPHPYDPGDGATAVAPKEAVGQQARRTLRPGRPLELDDLEPAPCVRKGQVVKVDTRIGGFRIRHLARAEEEAAAGEVVRVENVETGKRYFVRAVAPGVVVLPDDERFREGSAR